LVIAFWAFVFRVSCQHALDRHADTLDALNGRPSVSRGKQVEAYNPVAVDVGMHRDLTVWSRDKHYFRRLQPTMLARKGNRLTSRSRLYFYRIVVGEAKAKTICLPSIQRVVVEDSDVHLPALKVVGLYKVDSYVVI
jgi:hypothetical protein